MDPLITAALITGGFALAGGGLNQLYSSSSAKASQSYSKSQMRLQNAMNIYNFQHQNQWRVQDLRQAGLNPILSQTGGSAVPGVGLNSANVTPARVDFDTSAISRLLESKFKKEDKLASANLDKILDERQLLIANSQAQYSQKDLNYELARKAITDSTVSMLEDNRKEARFGAELAILGQQQREQNENQSSAAAIRKQNEMTTWYMEKQLSRLGSKAHNFLNWVRDFSSAAEPVVDLTKNAQKQVILKGR